VNFFLASRIFDRRIALLSTAFVLLADQFWQFSLSGLPQMLLLFLFSCAAWVLAVAIRANREGRGTIGLLTVLGVFLGLMALTHPLTLWISAAVGVFCALYFRARFPRFLIPVVVCLALFSIWIVRDFHVTRTPFGISPFAWLDGLSLSESGWMRELEPDITRVSVSEFRKRAQEEFNYQVGSLSTLLGGVIIAPLFFVSLLHRFKRDETEVFKWAILLMWLFVLSGAVLIGINHQNVSANQIHILFGPLMTCYGLAYVLVCWKRIQPQGAIFGTLFMTLLLSVTGLPALFGFLPGNPPLQFPPYLPPFMQIFASWTKPDEIIASDMPWAVAWYSDRKSLWLPMKLKTLTEFYDMHTLGAPIAGIYLTPVSRDLRYASEICNGEYKEWLPLILPDQKALEHFPLNFLI
jgi:4-amino-4-deoxy-L-arabinose transferase-like glycosyltransferase